MIAKIIMLAAVATLAAGCVPLHPDGCHKTRALDSCSTTRWDDKDAWGEQARTIRTAINAQLTDPARWEGKQCYLHIQFNQDGTTTSITTSDGNKAYCAAIKAAAEKATFPAFSNPEVYRNFKKTRMDMRGEDWRLE